MTWKHFQTNLPGKWVLAGEHAVLRGGSALALPLPDFTMRIRFAPNHSRELQVSPEASTALIRELVEKALDAFGAREQWPQGWLSIESSIPTGAGLGSSAALCAGITEWISNELSISGESSPKVARILENRFHGVSSGMDVAVILARHPIVFTMAYGAEILRIERLPRFTFHDTELRARTKDCVAQVESLARTHPETAARHDHHMREATRLAREGLELYAGTPKLALEQIAHSMTLAQACFDGWGLVPLAVRQLERNLLDAGALACKLTGAGGGGFLVALWPDQITRAHV